MVFTIKKSTTKEDFKNKFEFEQEDQLLNNTKKEIKNYEKKFNIKSADFYKKYINDELKYKEGYEEWYAKIKMLARYKKTDPKKIKV